MDKKRSFVLYDYREQLKLIPDDERGRLLLALMDYAADGKLPDNLNAAGLMCFAFIRQTMDRDNEKYESICKARAKAGSKGGRPRKTFADEEKQAEAQKPIAFFEKQNNPEIDYEIDYEIDHDLEKESVKKKVRFAPPTLDDVKIYCQEKGFSIDEEYFIDFYTSKDWMIGKNRMKDWRAAVRNWNRSQRQESTTKAKKNRFHNLEEHEYDYDKMVWEGINGGDNHGDSSG